MNYEDKMYKYLFTKVKYSDDPILKEFKDDMEKKYVKYIDVFNKNEFKIIKEDINYFNTCIVFVNKNIKFINPNTIIELLVMDSLIYFEIEDINIKKNILILLTELIFYYGDSLQDRQINLILLSIFRVDLPSYVMSAEKNRKFFEKIIEDSYAKKYPEDSLEAQSINHIKDALELYNLTNNTIDEKTLLNVRHSNIYKLVPEHIMNINEKIIKYYNSKYLPENLKKVNISYISESDIDKIINDIKSAKDLQNIIMLMKNQKICGPGFESLFMNLLPLVTKYGKELDDNFISFFIESYVQDLVNDYNVIINNEHLFKIIPVVLKIKEHEMGIFQRDPVINLNYIYISDMYIDKIRNGHYASLIGTIHHEIAHARQDLRRINGVVSYNDMIILIEQILRNSTVSTFYKNNYDNLKIETDAEYYGMSAKNDFQREYYGFRLDDIYPENNEQKRMYLSNFDDLEEINIFDVFSGYIYDRPYILKQYPQLKSIYKIEKGKVVLKSVEEIDKLINDVNDKKIDFNQSYPSYINGSLAFKPFNQKALLYCGVSKNQFMKLFERIKQIQLKDNYHK